MSRHIFPFSLYSLYHLISFLSFHLNKFLSNTQLRNRAARARRSDLLFEPCDLLATLSSHRAPATARRIPARLHRRQVVIQCARGRRIPSRARAAAAGYCGMPHARSRARSHWHARRAPGSMPTVCTTITPGGVVCTQVQHTVARQLAELCVRNIFS